MSFCSSVLIYRNKPLCLAIVLLYFLRLVLHSQGLPHTIYKAEAGSLISISQVLSLEMCLAKVLVFNLSTHVLVGEEKYFSSLLTGFQSKQKPATEEINKRKTEGHSCLYQETSRKRVALKQVAQVLADTESSGNHSKSLGKQEGKGKEV